MKRLASIGLLAAALAWNGPALAAQSSVSMDDPLRVDFKTTPPGLTESVVAERIRTAAGGRGWRVETESPGRMTLRTIVSGRHMVWIEVAYTTSAYTFQYVDSAQMRYRQGTKGIHPNYNLWIRQLAETINGVLGVTAVVSVGTVLPGVATASMAVPETPGTASATAVVAASMAGTETPATASATAVGAVATSNMPAPGTRWRYGYRDRRYDYRDKFFTVEVAGVNASMVQERFIIEGGQISERVIDADRIAFLSRPLNPNASVLELAPYSRDIREKPQAPEGYPGPAGAMWKIGTPDYVEEDVRVPAGTFKALRVQLSGDALSFGNSAVGRFTYTAWYSPELKRYVKTRHQTWSRTGAAIGDEDVHLVGYQRAK
jgi:hypothetical protein